MRAGRPRRGQDQREGVSPGQVPVGRDVPGSAHVAGSHDAVGLEPFHFAAGGGDGNPGGRGELDTETSTPRWSKRAPRICICCAERKIGGATGAVVLTSSMMVSTI
jgi:hypothetical protein